MSHSIEYYQRMSTEQLIHEMNHAVYTVDRNRARQVYNARIEQQRQQEKERSNSQIAAMTTQMNNLQSRLNNLTHQNADMSSIIRQQSDELRNLQHMHAQQVSAMRSDYNRRIQQVNAENRQALARLEEQMVNEDAKLRATIDENFQRTTRMISDVNSSLTNRINTIHANLSAQIADQQNQINSLDAKFQALHHNDHQLRENTLEFVDSAVALINSTIEYNNANRHNWRSGDLQALINTRDHVQTDLNSGMLAVGVARAQARDLFEQALRYRANVYADEREWQLRLATAQQCIDAANNDLEISRIIEADGMEVDVDYWTCGDLRRITDQLNDLQAMLENPNLTNEELDGIGALAETYRQEISASVSFAMQAVQCSRDRKELLEIAIDHIEHTVGNLHPVWQEYFSGDNRLGYRVYLTAPQTGERVVLTAEPSTERTDIRNQFRFDILSTGASVHNAADADSFTHAIAQALNEVEGCEFTTPNCTNQSMPAADNGQGNQTIWRTPDAHTQDAARAQATPVHAQRVPRPTPRPVHTFTPQTQI